jgi:hypothetical protein
MKSAGSIEIKASNQLVQELNQVAGQIDSQGQPVFKADQSDRFNGISNQPVQSTKRKEIDSFGDINSCLSKSKIEEF